MTAAVVISADRINHFRDLIDMVCAMTGEQLTTEQTWEFAREYARLEALGEFDDAGDA